MMNTRTISLGLAVGAFAFVPSASAQQYGQQMQQMPQQMQQRMQQMHQQFQQGQQQQQQQSGGQQDFSQQVRSFLQQAEQQLTQAVQQGNSSEIIQWTRQNVADNATFTTLMHVSGNGRTPSSLRAEYTDKQDMVRKQAMMFSLVPDLLKSVEDYNLDVQVQNVEQIDNNTAVVRTRISESMTLGVDQNARMAQAGMNWQNQQSGQYGQSRNQGQNQNQARQQSQGNQLGAALSGSGSEQASLSVSGTADCKHLIYRNQGQLMMGMSNCRAEASY